MEEIWIEAAGEDNLDRIIGKIGFLPVMPWVVNRLLSIIEHDKSNANDLAEVIASDQTLTARVLKMVNSAYYGISREINTVTEAVVILGFNALRSLVISISIVELFGDGKNKSALDHRSFWRHSIGCAVAAQELCRQQGRGRPEEAFVAGLLHDIGKVIFNEFTGNEYKAAVELTKKRDIAIREAERLMYGFDHSIMGAWLGSKWELPPSLQRVIAFHHRADELNAAEDLQASEMVRLITLADTMTKIADIGFSGDRTVHPLGSTVNTPGLSHEACVRIMRELSAKVSATAASFGLTDDDEIQEEAGPSDENSVQLKALVIKDAGSISVAGLALEYADCLTTTADLPTDALSTAHSTQPDIIVWEGTTPGDLPSLIGLLQDPDLAQTRKAMVIPPEFAADPSLNELLDSLKVLGLNVIHLPVSLELVHQAILGETARGLAHQAM